MKNATAAISITKRSPAVAISHFGMCISHALAGSDVRRVVFTTQVYLRTLLGLLST